MIIIIIIIIDATYYRNMLTLGGWVSETKAVTAFGPDTNPSSLHLTSNQQQLQNQPAYVVTNAIALSS